MSAYVAGVGMTRFGKQQATLKELARDAVEEAMSDAGIGIDRIEAAYCSNAAAGLITGQEMIRGQVELRPLGVEGIPIINVENACASGSTAFHLACQSVSAGAYDVALVLGVEKLTHAEKRRTFQAMATAVDIDAIPDIQARVTGTAASAERSFFMDLYAAYARRFMEETGATREDFARVAVKNQRNGARNPRAQYGGERTLSEILESREIVWPLTLLMCCPVSDGGAAAIVVSRRMALAAARPPIRVAASVIGSGVRGADKPYAAARRAAARAYESAGLNPDDVDVVELHDGTAAAELMLYEVLQLAAPGDAPQLLAEGATEIGGRIVVNPSGGLLSKGHPLGATGVAQVAEITWQLRGEAAGRQVEGARVGLTQNGGGWLEGDSAATSVHILVKD